MPYPETIKYIKKQIDEGINPDRIKKALLDNGYQQEIVDKLMKEAGVVGEEKKSSGIEKLLFKDVTMGVILLLVIGSLVYFNFFSDSKTELLAPKPIKLDFGRVSPLDLEENKEIGIDLTKYVKDKEHEFEDLSWSYNGKVCINIQINQGTAVLRSVFLPDCPTKENINFEVRNPDGLVASDNLVINIKQ
jgi:hypothetical protein